MDAGSLETLVARAGPLPDSVLARVAADVLEGLAWLHREKRMIHRDIKPANILLNSSGLPKITDFGVSTVLDVGASRAGVGASGSAKGTLCYMSPERLASQPYSFSCDIWSLAVTLLECSQGRYPFHTDQGPVSTMLEIMDCEAPLPVEGSCSPLFRAFLGACLRRDPRERPDALQARRLDWCHSGAAPYPTVAAFLASVFDPHEALQSLAQMFAAHYYRLIDAPPHERFALQGLYRADASFTLAGRIAVRGPEAICAALAALGETSHSPTHLDCQPFEGGGVLVLASGTVIASFETHRFCESFSLLPEEEGHWFLVNHWRQEYK
jgi:serine/threonine protein kinase